MVSSKLSSLLKRSPGDRGFITGVLGLVGIAGLAGVLLAGLLLPLTGTLGLTTKAAADHFEDLPDAMQTPALPQRTVVKAADGSTIATVWGDFGNRIVKPLSDMSPDMPHAIVAIEDARFYQHGGIDLKGTLRALLSNAQAGGVTQGGSTITQQYVKNVLLLEAGTDKSKQQAATADTFTRKLQELKYAIAAEQKFTKDDILSRYLNIVYFGNDAYGVEAAAERYFSTDSKHLTLTQAATLAAIVNSPSYYDPLTPSGAAETLQRRNIVLDKMADPALHYVTQAQADAAKKQPLGVKPTVPKSGCIAAAPGVQFYCYYVENELLSDPIYGKTAADRAAFFNMGGLTITTTMDPTMESSAQSAISSHVYATDSVASAAAVIEPGTGQIKAIAQSRPMGAGKGQTYLNYATDPKHGGGNGFQAGSTFKSFVGMAALESGKGPDTNINVVSPLDVSNVRWGICTGSGQNTEGTSSDWINTPPANQDGDPAGPMDMTYAFWKSINTYFIALEEQTGLCRPAQIAQAFGVTQDSDDGTGHPLDQFPTFTLGTNLITPIAMANAYATIAARGTYCTPTAITSITGPNGQNYPIKPANCHASGVDPGVTDQLTGMLEGVVSQGTAAGVVGANIDGHQVAGKTGTNDSLAMTWFDGYTPNLAAAVWTGDPLHPNAPQKNVTVGGQFYAKLFGASVSAPIWHDLMQGALQKVPVQNFVLPMTQPTGQGGNNGQNPPGGTPPPQGFPFLNLPGGPGTGKKH